MGNLKREPSSPTHAGQKRLASRSPSPALHQTKKQVKEEIESNNNLVKGNYPSFGRIKACSIKKADEMDANPPVKRLDEAIVNRVKINHSDDEKSVVFWMRMHDLRLVDSRGLSLASDYATEYSLPLIIIHVFSPQDYENHDRSPRRIDLVLRKLHSLQEELQEINIPLYTFLCENRHEIPMKVIQFAKKYKSNHLFGNLEYEIDECFRDLQTINIGNKEGVEVQFSHDIMLVPPFKVLTKSTNKPPVKYEAYKKSLQEIIEKDPLYREETDRIKGNKEDVKNNEFFKSLFENQIPDSIEGFECKDREKMIELWPVGRDIHDQILDRFLHTKSRQNCTESSPLGDGAENDDKHSRINKYADNRNTTTDEHTSKLSPYLASGQISIRQCFNKAQKLRNSSRLEIGPNTGVGVWSQQLVWSDFYQNILAVNPRISMGHPFLTKQRFIEWEYNDDHLKAWHEGRTGWPIVDAAMRQLTTTGWMHNRLRMTVASYLCKDLMLDWREGERIFAKELIDHDLGSNNGGWQWSADTGTDVQSFYRVFNPVSQAKKADPEGKYIHHWLPELKSLKPPVLFEPSAHLSKSDLKKLNYSQPLVDHKFARDRALSRYKKANGKQ